MVDSNATASEVADDLDQIETSAERRARQAVEGKAAMAEYRATRAAVDKRTLELRALRLAKEAGAKGGGGNRKRTGQEIAEEMGLFALGPPVKYRVGI
jgi:hypothetical protein